MGEAGGRTASSTPNQGSEHLRLWRKKVPSLRRGKGRESPAPFQSHLPEVTDQMVSKCIFRPRKEGGGSFTHTGSAANRTMASDHEDTTKETCPETPNGLHVRAPSLCKGTSIQHVWGEKTSLSHLHPLPETEDVGQNHLAFFPKEHFPLITHLNHPGPKFCRAQPPTRRSSTSAPRHLLVPSSRFAS